MAFKAILVPAIPNSKSQLKNYRKLLIIVYLSDQALTWKVTN